MLLLKLISLNNLFGGLGFGNWGLGIGPNPQSPIPNPQSPIPILKRIFKFINQKKIKLIF